MRLQDKVFSMQELLMMRQWLSMWESSMKLDMKFVQQAREALIYVDKTIWSNLISNETPWGVNTMWVDEKFEETVKELFGDPENVSKEP